MTGKKVFICARTCFWRGQAWRPGMRVEIEAGTERNIENACLVHFIEEPVAAADRTDKADRTDGGEAGEGGTGEGGEADGAGDKADSTDGGGAGEGEAAAGAVPPVGIPSAAGEDGGNARKIMIELLQKHGCTGWNGRTSTARMRAMLAERGIVVN